MNTNAAYSDTIQHQLLDLAKEAEAAAKIAVGDEAKAFSLVAQIRSMQATLNDIAMNVGGWHGLQCAERQNKNKP